jgi:hypothetical protein
MPWSGSGIYTRGYASWTSDASNGLPISATKFDLEDNDFAAGIQNCLTIDGQNKPNTTLTWAQALSLTKAADGTVFSASRTGGTNNPGFQINLTDAAGVVLDLTTAQQLALATNGASRLTLSGAGNAAIAAPSSGVALTVSGFAGQSTTTIASGNSGTQAVTDLALTRAGSTANAVSEGPCIGLEDITATTFTQLQHSGGQSELWQFNSGSWVQQWRVTTAGILQARDQGGTMQDVGWRGIPPNQVAANYTAVLSDRGKSININTNGIVITIPAGVFADGDVITITAITGVSCTIAGASGMTLFWAGNGATTGTRTLTGTGIATVAVNNGSQAYISGAGLT